MNSPTFKLVRNLKTIIVITVLSILTIALNACTTDADDSFDAATVCPSEGTNIYGMPNRGTFVDERDGQEYQYTTIGDQVWMAQSLNYDYPKAVCYDSLPENCEKYGRLYGGEYIKQLCPTGWRMPMVSDYEELMVDVDNKRDVLYAGYWENIKDTVNLNECGMALRAGGFAYLNEFREKNQTVSFWTGEIDRNYDNNDYFFTFYVEYGGYMHVSSSHWIETMKYYIRCIKEQTYV